MEERAIKLYSSEVRYIYRYNVGIIFLQGDIDFSVYQEINFFFEYLFEIRNSPIVIDLREVEFIDSTGGLRILQESIKKLGYERLALSNVNANIKRLFKIANMNEIPIYANVHQAVKELSVSVFDPPFDKAC